MKRYALFLILTLLFIGIASCTPSNSLIATYLYETKSAWTIQPTNTPYPSAPAVITKIITALMVPTETATQTLTATEISKNVWYSYGPPDAQQMTIVDVAIDPTIPSIIYAAGDTKGIFISVNDGFAWKMIAHFNLSYFTSIAIDPQNHNTIYVSALDGIWKTRDGGISWDLLTDYTMVGFGISYLLIDPNKPSTLFGGGDGGMYKSVDSGKTWLRINDGIPYGLSINTIVTDPRTSDILYAGGNYYGHISTGTIIKSIDGGKNWKIIKSDLYNSEYLSVEIDKINPSNVYVGMWGGIIKSVDGGDTWQTMNKGLKNKNINALTMDPTNSSILYAGTIGEGVYKTIDGGLNWFPINDGFPFGERVYSLAIDPINPGIVYAGTDEGVFLIHQM
jgi:photosystem II stability/assembly factor-like uncharacterized protein